MQTYLANRKPFFFDYNPAIILYKAQVSDEAQVILYKFYATSCERFFLIRALEQVLLSVLFDELKLYFGTFGLRNTLHFCLKSRFAAFLLKTMIKTATRYNNTCNNLQYH